MRAVLLLSGFSALTACSGVNPSTINGDELHQEAEGTTPRARVLKIALIVAEQHAEPVDSVGLLMHGVSALDAEAGVSPQSVPPFLRDALAAFDRSVHRLRDRDPTISDAHLVQVAATAIVASLGDQSRYLSAEDWQRHSTSLPSGQPKGGVG